MPIVTLNEYDVKEAIVLYLRVYGMDKQHVEFDFPTKTQEFSASVDVVMRDLGPIQSSFEVTVQKSNV